MHAAERALVRVIELLVVAVHLSVAVFVELDVDHVGVTAHGAVLDEFLDAALGVIERNHDLLAAGVTEVADLVAHRTYLSFLEPTCLGAPRKPSGF